ncbi:PAS domain-containing protein [Pontibacter populi]|uniref:histidine kinase n=1 Tax=Pontibacter populi TaxID=890055 RepID=A0ABV1RYB0_9BACT
MLHETPDNNNELALDFQLLFGAMIGNFVILKPNPPHFTILAVSDDMVQVTEMEREEIVSRSVFEVFPGNPDTTESIGFSVLRESLNKVVETKELDEMPVVRYDLIKKDGGFEERYWQAKSRPVIDAKGDVLYILHSTNDVTDQVKAKKQEVSFRDLEKKYSLFMQATVAVCIVSGPENIVELANKEYLSLLNKTPDIISKPIFEIIPEAKEQGFPELLEQVRISGKAFHATEYPLTLVTDGKEEVHYHNFTYGPYYVNTGDEQAKGVFCVSYDVTEQVLSRKKVEESELQVRTIIESSHHPIGVYVGKEMRIQFANQALKDGLGKGNDIVGKLYKDVLPELESQEIFALLDQVYTTGIPFQAKNHPVDLVIAGKLKSHYFDLSFTPLYNTAGEVYGVVNTGADVTELYLAHQHVAESEERYRTLIEEAPIATALYLGPELKIRYANEIMLTYWGKDESVVGKTLREALPELENQPFPDLLEKVYRTGEAYIGLKEKADLLINGRLQSFYFNYTYKPLFNASGEVYGLHHTASDVTDEVLFQNRLKESEARFRNLVREASVGIVVLNGEELRIDVVNDAYARLLGSTVDELSGKKLFSLLPDAETAFKPYLDQVMRTGKPLYLYDQPYYVTPSNKKNEGFLNLVYQPYKETDGRITGIMVLCHDVTEQVLATRKFEEGIRDLQNLADAMPQLVWIAAPDGRVTYYNERVSHYSGATKLEDGSWNWESLVMPVDVDETVKAWDKAVREGSVYEIEHRVKMTDGTWRWHLSRAFPQLDSNGKVQKWFGTATDVHENKEQQEALKASNIHLKRVNNDMDNFIYTASHDLKAPISNIEGLLTILADEYSITNSKSDDAQMLFDMMKASVDRFKSTIESLTDVAKLQQEHSTEVDRVNLTDVIKEVTLDLAPLIKTTGAVLSIDVADDTFIRFSKKNLRSVVYNLLSNAIKYKAHNLAPQIDISCKLISHYFIITVADNGLGMDEVSLGSLFTMFRRFHDHVEGTGVGLYMVKKIVENAGGSIAVESKENVGTTFKVTIPV